MAKRKGEGILRFMVLQNLSYKLSDNAREDWRCLADELGFDMTAINGFIAKSQSATNDIPCYFMLKEWAGMDGSTENVLKAALEKIRRYDAVSLLEQCLQSRCGYSNCSTFTFFFYIHI